MHDVEAYAGVVIHLHLFLTSKLNGDDFSLPHRPLYPGENYGGDH